MRILKLGDDGVRRYTYDQLSVVTEANQTNTTVSKYDYGLDQLVSLDNTSEGRSFFHLDFLGSTANLTDGIGDTRQSILYDAWGNERDRVGTSLNKFTFTGHEKDGETGLIYAKARFYDPDIGRFLSQDPFLGDATNVPSLQRYMYAYQNPLNLIDPSGNAPICPSCRDESSEERARRVRQGVEEVKAIATETYKGVAGAFEGLGGLIDDFITAPFKLVAFAQRVDNMSPGEQFALAQQMKETIGREISLHGSLLEQGVKNPEEISKTMIQLGSFESARIGTRVTVETVTVVGGAAEVVQTLRATRAARAAAAAGEASGVVVETSAGTAIEEVSITTGSRRAGAVGEGLAGSETTAGRATSTLETATPPRSAKSRTPTDAFKEQLLERPGKSKSQNAMRGAQEELAGKQTEGALRRGREFDHVTKVRNAQRGLVNRIEQIKRTLGRNDLPPAQRQALQAELSEASTLLDKSEGFVPR